MVAKSVEAVLQVPQCHIVDLCVPRLWQLSFDSCEKSIDILCQFLFYKWYFDTFMFAKSPPCSVANVAHLWLILTLAILQCVNYFFKDDTSILFSAWQESPLLCSKCLLYEAFWGTPLTSFEPLLRIYDLDGDIDDEANIGSNPKTTKLMTLW